MPLRWGICPRQHHRQAARQRHRRGVRRGRIARRRARRAYAREKDRARPRLIRGAAGRSRRRRDLQPAAQRAARGVVAPRAPGRQARAVREAAHPPPRGRRSRLRRRRARRPRAGRGLHVAPPPAGCSRARAALQRRHRRPARHPLGLRLPPPRRPRRHPRRHRRRRRPDDVGCHCVSGCRTLAGAEPERAFGSNVPTYHGGVDVSLSATLRFPATCSRTSTAG